jgi:hypothetical protein
MAIVSSYSLPHSHGNTVGALRNPQATQVNGASLAASQSAQ